jgi:hypothetical protein
VTTLFIDESKASGYIIVSAAIVPTDVARMRKSVADLRKAGQRRIHFVKESDSRRREILSAFGRLGVECQLYRVAGMNDAAARERCLVEVVADAATAGVTRIVLERDDSIVEFDRKILYRELDVHGIRDQVTYAHETSASELLLCIPDAVAWSYARGGEWKTRIQPILGDVKLLR